MLNSAIHKAAGLTVNGRSMISTGTISCGTQKCPLAVNGSCWQEPPLGGISAGRNHLWGGIPAGGFLGMAGN